MGGSGYGPDWSHRWLREKRISHEDLLRLYLERTAGERLLAFRDAERATALMADPDSFDAFLRSLDDDRLEDVIAQLEAYEDDFAPEHVVPATTVLLNLVPEIPERPRGVFDFDARLVVGRVTYRLLRSLKTPEAIEEAARQILPQLRLLSSKLEVIDDLGYREDAGHKLVSRAAAAELEVEWRDQVRSASIDELVDEPELLRVLLVAKHDSEESGEELPISDSPQLTLAILRAAHVDVRSQSVGTRTVRRSPVLAWDALADLYGGEAVLKERIEALKAAAPEEHEDLLELAERYAAGWRPNKYDVDDEP